MNTHDIVQYLASPLIFRKEIFGTAIDRGMGDGMQIEKWFLIEMITHLKRLQADGILKSVEGEHKYPLKKGKMFEHCDLWWKIDEEEHWLEVKTIVFSRKQLGKIEDVAQDLEKIGRLTPHNAFHHLTVLFPIKGSQLLEWQKSLKDVYSEHGFSLDAEWMYDIWEENKLSLFLYSKDV